MRKGFAPGDPRASAAGARGGRIRGAQLRTLRELAWRQKYPGVPPRIARVIYIDGYNAGHQRGLMQRKACGLTGNLERRRTE